jgi:hypothetical protein
MPRLMSLRTTVAIGCLGLLGCGAGDPDRAGTLTMGLTTSAGGALYRLVDVSILLNGPEFQFLGESNPDEDRLSVTLQAGAYSASLQSWRLERQDSAGIFSAVKAELVSSSAQAFTIFDGTVTTLSYAFRTDGVSIKVGAGRLQVLATVEELAPVCTVLGDDCAAGAWCPPAELTGAPLACLPAGSAPVGQPCDGPTSCVANASCYAADAGALCRALCTSAHFGEPCPSEGTCQPAGAGYGVCLPGS